MTGKSQSDGDKEVFNSIVTGAMQFLSDLESGCAGMLQRIIAILGQLW
jgi:hypothetical protein